MDYRQPPDEYSVLPEYGCAGEYINDPEREYTPKPVEASVVAKRHKWIKWLMFGPIRIQPSEFAKIAVVIATAVFLDKAGWRIELFWKGAVRALCIIGLPMALAVAEPDFGSTMVIALSGGVLMFIAGMRWRHMFLLAGVGVFGNHLFLNGKALKKVFHHGKRLRRCNNGCAWISF